MTNTHANLIESDSLSVDDNDTRIPTLRARCRQRKQFCGAPELRRLLSAQSLSANGHLSWQIRMGLRAQHVLENLPLDLDDLELLIGRPAPFPDVLKHELASADSFLRSLPPSPGQTGHCELDLTEVFASGISGMLNRVQDMRSRAEGERADFYTSVLSALSGLQQFIQNAALTAENAKRFASPQRQLELEQIAVSCRRIASAPPQTFRDAIQLLWLVDLAVMLADGAGLVVPGHLDRTLWLFYKRDLAAGTITRSQALVLVECLYILINEFIPDGLAMSVMVSGRDRHGLDLTNDLSFICLEALSRTRMIYPTVGVCYHNGTPLSLVDLAIDQIIDGLTTPAFFNDAVIQRGLRALGVPADEACDYINSTCVEITPVGASNVWVASPYFNLPGLLLEEIQAQATHHEADTFDAFVSAYQHRLSAQIANEVAQQNKYRMQRERNGRKPLQSAFTRDCLERGRDLDDNGARYNWVECSFVGLANLIDSLIVIKHEVFGTHPFSFAQLAALLDADYEGAEGHRLRFLNRYAKYGNADPEPDTLTHQITTYLRNECQKHRMQPDNSPFVPGTFCWIMHEQLGKVTGATPDGRRATVALSDAAGPAQGRERHGPTAAIRSTTSWDHSMMIGGLAYNMKFTSALFADTNARGHLRNLILTYLRLGGLETQINIVNRATLLLARQNPEAYADLIVRIGGYCDYFTRLSPRMQDELIMRAEYETF